MAAAPMPIKTKIAITASATVVAVGVLLWLTWKDLGQLGKMDQPDLMTSSLPGFIQREGGDGNIWGDIDQTLSDIDAQQKIIDTKPAYQAQLDGLQNQIVKAQERLPREQEKAEMRALIENIARDVPSQFGQPKILNVSIFEDNGKDRTPNLKSISFHTQLTGTTNGIIAYIDAIEKNPRFMTIGSINLQMGTLSRDLVTGKLAHGPHTCTLDIISYVYNPPVKK
jgi:hypothetical protein